MTLKSFNIDDDLGIQDTGAIEVTLHLDTGERRWCYFMTPSALTNSGNSIEGTQIRFHFDAPHMIVVAGPLDASIIELALRDIDRQGLLMQCSRAL